MILDWPFDANEILLNKKRYRKELSKSNANGLNKKIAVLGGSTTSNVVAILELFLLHHGIVPEFYESEYNQFYTDAMFPSDTLQKFKPDIVYFHTGYRNIIEYPEITASVAAVNKLLDSEYTKYVAMWDAIYTTFNCCIIQNNFELPAYRLLGNKDASDIHGRVNFIGRLNQLFYEYANSHDNFFINDINYQSAVFGLDEWNDPHHWYMYKYSPAPSAVPLLAFNLANIIKSIYGKNKRGLVLDLDNTLWGGVVGDDGVDNLDLGPETPAGQAYGEFQRYLLDLARMGNILCVNTKNDMENALSGLRHPDGILKEEDMACIMANWESKDLNFHKISEKLNLLPEHLVFIDDNPAEREIVSSQIPGVKAPPLESVESYIWAIDRSGFFELTNISSDDLMRNEMYKENAQRETMKAAFDDYNGYLRSLCMEATIKPFESKYFTRIAQLTNKSNQFNLTTKRFTQAEIEAISASEEYLTLYGKLADRFGDNGVVSLIVGRKENTELHTDLWLMSCRVLKRGMEQAMLDVLIDRCRAEGIAKVIGYYYPTKKNGMVKEFYGAMGYTLLDAAPDGITRWVLNVDEYENQNSIISVTC